MNGKCRLQKQCMTVYISPLHCWALKDVWGNKGSDKWNKATEKEKYFQRHEHCTVRHKVNGFSHDVWNCNMLIHHKTAELLSRTTGRQAEKDHRPVAISGHWTLHFLSPENPLPRTGVLFLRERGSGGGHISISLTEAKSLFNEITRESKHLFLL